MLVRVKLFGMLSANQKFVDVDIFDGISLQEFKLLVASKLEKELAEKVLESAVVINDESLLSDNDLILEKFHTIALLPPVCGG